MISLLLAIACSSQAPAERPVEPAVASTEAEGVTTEGPGKRAAPEPPTGPPTSRGVVLHVEGDGLVVQHDDTLGRLTPGVEHYSVGEPRVLAGLEVGATVDLWLSEIEGGRRADALVVTGTAEPAAPFVEGGHALAGTVVRVDGGTLTLDHEPIPGVMGAMVMPFRVGARTADFAPGDRVRARLISTRYGFALAELEKTGTTKLEVRSDVVPIEVGEVLPAFRVPVAGGAPLTVGESQGRPTVLTFIYTRCPDPSFCPAVVSRLLALQEQVGPEARIVTLTLDPEYDTLEVLERYGAGVGANPRIWKLGRLEPADLNRLAMLAGLAVTVQEGRIEHLLRLLVLDGDGKLLERYDDNRWPMDRVMRQLRTGAPLAAHTGTLQVEQ